MGSVGGDAGGLVYGKPSVVPVKKCHLLLFGDVLSLLCELCCVFVGFRRKWDVN